MRVTKRIKNRLIESFLSVSYAVHALRAVAYNLVQKLSCAKSHSGMCLQYWAFGGPLQSVCHGGLRMRTAFLCVATYASVRSEERRVGKECRSRWAPYHLKKKKKDHMGGAKNKEKRERRDI